MNIIAKEELEKSLAPIQSIISKCEKCLPKLKFGTSQHSLTKNRINALKVAEALILRELGDGNHE